ncbi:MAG: hypothetical protein HC850_07775 [Rhodomicrobium sp.]|nr:hypothetical protein [Rhodomicrobium sp.]
MTLAAAATEDCSREAFSQVVGETSAALTAMNESQKQGFQAKLSALKQRKGWTDADYVAKAASYVRDDRIAALDVKIQSLLAKIPELGASAPALAGATPPAKDMAPAHCDMLAKLRGVMAEVIENNRAKWVYMTEKLDGALEERARRKPPDDRAC